MWYFGANKIDKTHLYRMPGRPLPIGKGKAGLWTGEIREPKEGEFYIDEKYFVVFGAIQDMDEKKHMAKIVNVQRYEYYMIEGD
jgi:hypothetical protein